MPSVAGPHGSSPSSAALLTGASNAAAADSNDAPSPYAQPQHQQLVQNGSGAATLYQDVPGRRPSSAPGNKNGGMPPPAASAFHNSQQQPLERRDLDKVKRATVKPLLLRSRSEHGLRGNDEAEHHPEDEIYDWGARHGFEDHYQSEDIISQLANVSPAFSCPSLPVRELRSLLGCGAIAVGLCCLAMSPSVA